MSWVKNSLHRSVPAILEDFSLTTQVRKHEQTKGLGAGSTSGWSILDSHIIRISCHHHLHITSSYHRHLGCLLFIDLYASIS